MATALGPGAMVDLSQQQADESQQVGDAMMSQLTKVTFDQMKNTMETGVLKMISSLGEGIAKTFKASGDAVKGLS